MKTFLYSFLTILIIHSSPLISGDGLNCIESLEEQQKTEIKTWQFANPSSQIELKPTDLLPSSFVKEIEEYDGLVELLITFYRDNAMKITVSSEYSGTFIHFKLIDQKVENTLTIDDLRLTNPLNTRAQDFHRWE